jgi:hypothetical protein
MHNFAISEQNGLIKPGMVALAMGWVAKIIEMSRRRDILTFRHPPPSGCIVPVGGALLSQPPLP